MKDGTGYELSGGTCDDEFVPGFVSGMDCLGVLMG